MKRAQATTVNGKEAKTEPIVLVRIVQASSTPRTQGKPAQVPWKGHRVDWSSLRPLDLMSASSPSLTALGASARKSVCSMQIPISIF